MVNYHLMRKGKIVLSVQVPGDTSDRVCIPNKIYAACWLDRLLNREVQVYRGLECVFNWPARRMAEHEKTEKQLKKEQADRLDKAIRFALT